MTDALVFRRYVKSDESQLLTLNQSVVELTSPLDSNRLELMQSQGCQITVAELSGDVVGILMCFTDGSDYDSTNYQWFSHRVVRFLYIDRIIVAQTCRGAGAGQRFYQHLKEQASEAGLHWLAAEINSRPPNTGSLEFHRKQGFIPVGEQSIGDKTVSMQLFSL